MGLFVSPMGVLSKGVHKALGAWRQGRLFITRAVGEVTSISQYQELTFFCDSAGCYPGYVLHGELVSV